MTPTRRFRVKFASGDPDVFVDVEDTAVVKSVVDKVREIKGLPEGRFVRLLSAGHELYEEDAVLDAPGDVLHCVTSDYGPKRGPSGGRLRMTVDQLRGDWFDMVDPGVVLMWIFGVMLGLFWILYFLCGEMFDTASVAMLALMTLAFMVPFLVARIPFNTPWNTSWDEQMPPENLDRTSTYYGAARYRAVRRASRSRNRRAFHSDKVPPRPHARLQGPGS